MKNQIDERKLTDYILGELSGEEARRIEEALGRSEELRREADEIRKTVALLSEGLAGEASPALSAPARAEIERAASEPGGRRWLAPTLYHYAAGLLAASLILVVFLKMPGSEVIAPGDPASLTTSPITDDGPVSDAGRSELREDTGTPPESAIDRSAPEPPPVEVGSKEPARVRSEADGTLSREAEEQLRTSPDDKRGGRDSLQDLHQAEIRQKPKEQEGKVEAKTDASGLPQPRENFAYSRSSEAVGRSVAVLPEASVPGGVQMLRTQAMSPMAVRRVDALGADIAVPPIPPGFNREGYDRIDENEFIRVTDQPLSTFSIDVDTASYANVRRFLNQKQLPPPDAVRIEELINYFSYDYPQPSGKDPFSVNIETAPAPWNPEHLLVRFGLKGKEIDLAERKPGNFVFLIDVSGSMQPENKLPLLKRAFRLMVEHLDAEDRVALVVYAGASGLVLASTSCEEKETILQALEKLEAGGSTNGGSGIVLAYRQAQEHFIEGGVNRVILATDGDFNVGVTNQGELTRLIEEKAQTGVFLSVLGFGMGNYQDSNLEKLADRGNGNYAYIDTLQEARKVLVEQMGGTLVTIAKDVKIQVEFNPSQIEAYRLVGYENRLLRNQDFNDDTKDAGEIGAGHMVTVFYEIVPRGVEVEAAPKVDPLKYQMERRPTGGAPSDELLTLKLRYKEPDGDTSRLIERPVPSSRASLEKSSRDFRFAAAVASFGMLLRDSAFKGEATFEGVLEMARGSLGEDPGGYRAEFVKLVKLARAIRQIEELDAE